MCTGERGLDQYRPRRCPADQRPRRPLESAAEQRDHNGARRRQRRAHGASGGDPELVRRQRSRCDDQRRRHLTRDTARSRARARMARGRHLHAWADFGLPLHRSPRTTDQSNTAQPLPPVSVTTINPPRPARRPRRALQLCTSVVRISTLTCCLLRCSSSRRPEPRAPRPEPTRLHAEHATRDYEEAAGRAAQMTARRIGNAWLLVQGPRQRIRGALLHDVAAAGAAIRPSLG